jgi:hypothetical protein
MNALEKTHIGPLTLKNHIFMAPVKTAMCLPGGARNVVIRRPVSRASAPGKSTLFQWLTGETPDPVLVHKTQSAMAVVREPRVDDLCKIYHPISYIGKGGCIKPELHCQITRQSR